MTSIIVFKNKYHENHIYIHYDGHPSHRLVEIQEFLKWNESRNGDVSYSAANFMFWYKMESLRRNNEFYKNDKSRTITTIDDILTPRKNGNDLHKGIGVAHSNWIYYQYKYVVDFTAKTIRVTGSETDATVTFDQVVEFDKEDGTILETQIPAN